MKRYIDDFDNVLDALRYWQQKHQVLPDILTPELRKELELDANYQLLIELERQ